jgi:hypothetical protein
VISSLVLLACFSDRQPGVGGPRRVREAELRDAFADDWVVGSIEAARLQTNIEPGGAQAWLARFTRATGDDAQTTDRASTAPVVRHAPK